MLMRILSVGVLLVAASSALGSEKQILRYKGTSRLRVAGKDHLMVIAEPAKAQHAIRLVVDNSDPDGGYAPIPDEFNVIKNLHAGDLIECTWDVDHQNNNLLAIAKYDLHAGENAPHGYVFQHLEQASVDSPNLVVVLEKLGETVRGTIACNSDAEGQLACDHSVQATLNLLHEGDSVYVEFASESEPTVTVLMQWTDLKIGKLLRVMPVDVKGDKGMGVEIVSGTSDIIATMIGKLDDQGKWSTDAKVLAGTRRCRLNGPCRFRVQSVDGVVWLREMEPEPELPVAHQAPAPRNQGGSASGGTSANGLPKGRVPGGGVPGVGGVGF